MLLGETDEELKEQVKMWIIYSHIAKSMPPLAKHWNGAYPDAKQGIKEVIRQIKERNEAHRAANEGEDENPLKRFYPGQHAEDRTRTTCCLYYATDENGVKCRTCPRNKHKERVS
ncbi:DUF2573 family protein [Bacillus licheniformis]|nr:DUF2573 family protein [Bacillus licheniformis]